MPAQGVDVYPGVIQPPGLNKPQAPTGGDSGNFLHRPLNPVCVLRRPDVAALATPPPSSSASGAALQSFPV